VLGSSIKLTNAEESELSKLTQKDRFAIFSPNLLGKINQWMNNPTMALEGVISYDHQLMMMTTIVAEYLEDYFEAQTSHFGEQGDRSRTASDAMQKVVAGSRPKIRLAPAKTFNRMRNKDYANKVHYPAPSAQYNKDIIRIAIETDTPKEQIELFKEIGRTFKVVGVKNSFSKTDTEAASGSGLEMVLVNIEFTPKKDKTNDGEALTFKDMLDDTVGYDKAVAAAIKKGTPYKKGVVEPFLRSIQSSPIVVIAEIQLLLSFYLRCRKITHLYFKVDRAKTIGALQQDCAAFGTVDDSKILRAADGLC